MNARHLQRLLIIARPAGRHHPSLATLCETLSRSGREVVCATSDRYRVLAELLGEAGQADRTPDAVLMELADGHDLLPVQHLRRVLRAELPASRPLLFALAREQHLVLPELVTLVDDFALAPYQPAEVLARLLVMHRRAGGEAGHVLRLGDLEIDPAARRVGVTGSAEALPLTPREFDVLAFLALHRGKAFSRDMLLMQVWGRGFAGGPRTVDIHVLRLRQKLPPAQAALLETVRQVGYRLRATAV